MNRLTIRNSDGTVSQPTNVTIESVFEKLAEYEDLFEKWGIQEFDAQQLEDWHDRMLWHVKRCGALADKLAKYKNAEEQMRLVVLPCAVGDTVYTNCAMQGWYKRQKDKPYSAKVVFIGLNSSEVMGYGFVNVELGEGQMLQFNFSDFGKTVFLAPEKAVAALNVPDINVGEKGADECIKRKF